MKKKVKALVLLSGGLDSMLAAKLLQAQGIEVEAINFRTNFCGPSKRIGAACRQASDEIIEKLKDYIFQFSSKVQKENKNNLTFGVVDDKN